MGVVTHERRIPRAVRRGLRLAIAEDVSLRLAGRRLGRLGRVRRRDQHDDAGAVEDGEVTGAVLARPPT